MDLITQLKRDEGLRLKAYSDSVGIKTIGYGHNLVAHGQESIDSCTPEQAEDWLIDDSIEACKALSDHLPWTDTLDEPRRGVLQNMTFNIGINSLLGFHRTLGLIQASLYSEAAEAMLESKWAKQVGKRAERLSEQMRLGAWR